jgi:hypothetical protein
MHLKLIISQNEIFRKSDLCPVRPQRPQIYDLLQRVDSSVQHRQPKTARALKSATAVSVGVYVSQEDDWERAGIDASAVARPISKAT